MADKKSKSKRIRWIVGGAVLVVLLVILAGSLMGGGEEGVEVETTEVSLRDVTQVVTASGKVQPEVEVKMSPDVSGEIVELTVEEGDVVKKGDLLVRIRSDYYEAQEEQSQAALSQQRAGLERAEADLIRARQEYERAQKLHESGTMSDSEFQAAKANYEIARANRDAANFSLESSEANLRQAAEQLQKTAIYAPMTGTVSQLNVELGERVVGTSQMAGTEMMRIAQLDQMEMEVDVNENDVVNVAIGDTARVEIDAFPDRPFRGLVTQIANSARVTSAGTQNQITTFPVTVRILDANASAGEGPEVSSEAPEVPIGLESAHLRPGMSGTVDIFTDRIESTLAVPIQAVTVRDFNQVLPDSLEGDQFAEDLRRVVFVVREDTADMMEVKTGIADATHIAIIDGVTEGDQVIIGPYSQVSRDLDRGDLVRSGKGEGGKS